MVKQRGDNSCLFHSLSFCLSYDGIVSNIHEDLSGFVLREQICSYIRDNEDVVISISSDEHRTMSEADGMDGYTCSSYYVKMMNSKEWGSDLEIAAAAELFQIGIRVYVPVPKNDITNCWEAIGALVLMKIHRRYFFFTVVIIIMILLSTGQLGMILWIHAVPIIHHLIWVVKLLSSIHQSQYDV